MKNLVMRVITQYLKTGVIGIAIISLLRMNYASVLIVEVRDCGENAGILCRTNSLDVGLQCVFHFGTRVTK